MHPRQSEPPLTRSERCACRTGWLRRPVPGDQASANQPSRNSTGSAFTEPGRG